ncbi:Lrp/AsnC family transcriptional regulator [Streptomyces decoyicus]|nr:Lrp/AsnC family transcriptional regulator [Streptomyces decoyicus]
MAGASLPESVSVQPDDVRIIRALQIAPRASFASIAVALGLTEGAVNRRYRRLRADGVIRVAGVVNPGALGQSCAAVPAASLRSPTHSPSATTSTG